MVNKRAYFQGTEEPAPKGQKKYKEDPSILVQPRFEEPFFRNYDLYDVCGIDGPAQYGPGSGWNHMNEHKSVQEFLEFRRKRLKGKYVADDFWIEDTAANYKQRTEKMKVRALLLSRMVKEAQYMLPPKEHGTSIYDAKNSPYQGIPKIPKQLKKNQDRQKVDDNAIDFDIDSQIGQGTNYPGTSEDYQKPMELGPAINADPSSMPEAVGLGDTESYSNSAQIGGYLDRYLPQEDADGKPASELDFGHDLTDGAEMPNSLDPNDLERLTKKYLSPRENGLFGLPDGISPPDDIDPNATVNEPNPEYGETESGNTMYEDKWNI